MTIYKTLKHDHDEVKNLLSDLENDPLNLKIFKKFEDDLKRHDQAEEKTFYKSLKEKTGNLGVLVDLAEEEHKAAEKFIKLYHKASDEEAKKTILLLIKKSVLAHIDKEENEIFKLAKKYFTKDEDTKIERNFNDHKESKK